MFAAPESELLRCCARRALDPETAGRIRELVERPIDWDDLLVLARSHGMMPLLHWHLSAPGMEGIPVAIAHRLSNAFQASSAHNLFLTGRLVELLQLLRAHSIPAVPYKGPFLAHYVYGNLALRQFVDLDILVPRDRAAQARDLVAHHGYPLPGRAAEHRTERSFLRWEWEFAQISSDGSFRVEIQWAFAPYSMAFPITFESLRPRLRTTAFAGIEVLSLQPSDLLLVLCAHGAKHRWERLEWICAVSELLKAHGSEIDWNALVADVDRLGIRRMVLLGLTLAVELGAPVSDEVRRLIGRDRIVALLAVDVSRRLRFPPRVAGVLDYLSFQVRSRERSVDKARYISRYLMKPRNAAPAIKRLWFRTFPPIDDRLAPKAAPEHLTG